MSADGEDKGGETPEQQAPRPEEEIKKELEEKAKKELEEDAKERANAIQKELDRQSEGIKKTEQELAKEAELERIENHRKSQDAQRAIASSMKAQAIAEEKKEKEDREAHKLELKAKLRQDYIDRFGVEPPEEDKDKEVKEKSLKDQVAFYINKLKKEYKDSDAAGLKTCLTTLKMYVDNLHKNPLEAKFKVIKIENKAFQSRVAPYDGVLDLLDCLGFENKGETLEQRKSIPDGFLCGVAVKFLDLVIGQL